MVRKAAYDAARTLTSLWQTIPDLKLEAWTRIL